METSLNFSLTSSQLSCNAIHQLPTLLSPRIFRGSSKHWRKKQLTTYPGHSQSRPSGSIRVGKHEMDGQDSFPVRMQQFNSYEEVTEVTGNKYPVIDQIYALLEMGGE